MRCKSYNLFLNSLRSVASRSETLSLSRLFGELGCSAVFMICNFDVRDSCEPVLNISSTAELCNNRERGLAFNSDHVQCKGTRYICESDVVQGYTKLGNKSLDSARCCH